MFNVKSHRSRSAFTLIELLTVIAIIGILAAILIPTVGAVRKRALKAQCGSNLHQMGMAINLYMNDNKQVLPNGTIPNPRLQWFGVTERQALMSYGMTWEMFFCQGNPTYVAANMTDANRNMGAGGSTPIGYVYLPGTTYNVTNQSGQSVASRYRETRFTKITYRLIAADLNRKYLNAFTGGTNHADSEMPIGGNHLYVDGSVKWVPASDFLAKPAVSGDSSDYFFKTED